MARRLSRQQALRKGVSSNAELNRAVNNFGKRGMQHLPNIVCIMELPELLDPDKPRSRANSAQRKAVGDALMDAVSYYHKTGIPDHFHRQKQKRYNFKRRAPKTRKIKRFKGIEDWNLVEKQNLKQAIIRRIDVRRVGLSRGISAIGTMYFPAGFRPSRATDSGITTEVMKREIVQTTAEERRELSAYVGERYVHYLMKALGPRNRKRFQFIKGSKPGFQATPA